MGLAQSHPSRVYFERPPNASGVVIAPFSLKVGGAE
jgi:hypothetical protein